MAASDVNYHVKVPLNATSFPTGDRAVIWNSGSGKFDMHPTHPVSFRYQYAGNADNTFAGGNEYKLYSSWTNLTNNTSTNDFDDAAYIAVSYLPYFMQPEGVASINCADYLNSFHSGSIEIIADVQDDAQLTFGRYEITEIVQQTTNAVYKVNVLASHTDAGYEQQEGWEASFIFKGTAGGGGGSGDVGEITPVSDGGTDQFILASQTIDGTQSVTSGSKSLTYRTLVNASGADTRSLEILAQSGSGAGSNNETIAFVTKIPHRTQATNLGDLNPNQSNYDFPGTTPVASAYEHLLVTRSGALSAGQKSDFITISVPSYKGSGSFEGASANDGISGSYNYVKLEHMATSKFNTRTQQCTHHFTWYRDSSNNAQDLRVTSVENVRSPVNELIIDPRKTTGSWDSDGNLVVSLYHYNVDYAQHIFKYLVV